MNALAVLVAAAALGIDTGWEPVAGGGVVYTIQIEPEAVDGLLRGQDIYSDIPRDFEQVTSFRIMVGNDPLLHEGEPLPPLPARGGFADDRDFGPLDDEEPSRLRDDRVQPAVVDDELDEEEEFDPDEDESPSDRYADRDEAEEERPWPALVATVMALMASLATNFYLGWIHQSLRERYRSLVATVGT